MERSVRIVLGLLFALLIVAMLALARGEAGRGDLTASPTASIAGPVA